MDTAATTPIRQQYLRIKRQHPRAIVLFRLGDFYETFDEDARVLANELEIVLTSREMGKGNRVPMAGIPHHALEGYLARLINHGHRVAICEQVTKPGDAKGIVEREVVRVVTPGTVVEPGLLDGGSNNYLAGVVLSDDEAAVAYVDITTSEFATTQLPADRLLAEMQRLRPAEIICNTPEDLKELAPKLPVTPVDEYWFEEESSRQALLDHFGTTTLEGFGLARLTLATRAAGAVIRYLQDTQKASLGQLARLSVYTTGSYMALDAQTQSNLELFRSAAGTASGSLLATIDMTRTPMGSRLLKRWLGQPLLDVKELTKRQDAVDWFLTNPLPRSQVAALLGKVSDLERLINRVGSGIAYPRELIALKRSLERVPEIKEAIACGAAGCGDAEPGAIGWLADALKPREDVIGLIGDSIVGEPASSPGEGGVIRPGFSEELDNLRQSSGDARQYLAGLERHEQESTGIKSLKVGYNRVFGYYFEVSKANLSQVPEHYIRKQTLVNGERYYTSELKEYESLILNARERIGEVETNLYQRVCSQVATVREKILALAGAIAAIDTFSSLAEVAVRHGYVRPELSKGNEIVIVQGRHPVVERAITDGSFVANDVHLANDDAQLIILTGPNMAGKSTYLRQVALIALMAQIGSFVPADSAKVGLVDRIFTRIGARDDLAAGQSTFMLEMAETANILNNATPKSLLILDEIGRGTSTYDGLSIARAVAEYIHNHPRLGAKTLFATHYHEMVELASFLPRVRNFNVAVSEDKGEVVFLHRIVPGGVDKSYGIHVAKLAGLPRSVVHRAGEVLDELEGDSRRVMPSKRARRKAEPTRQLPLLGAKSPLAEEIEKLEVDSMTPLEALTRLYELQKKARED